MILARTESKAFQHEYVGTEHILLGLILENDGIAANVLRNMDIEADAIRAKIEEQSKPGTGASVNPPFTPRTKKALEYAVQEASSLGHNYIGTEHLLLGIIKDEANLASQILISLGIDLDDIRQDTYELLGVERAMGAAPEQEAEDKKVRVKKGKTKTPKLDALGRDLTQMAEQGLLDPVIGRIAEIDRILMILSRRLKNSPLILSAAGAGKTAIVEGIAQRIVSGDVPDLLLKHRIVSLDLALVVAGTKFRGEFEARLREIISEVKKSKNVILFIDEIHTLVGAGSAEGAIDAANMLKPALSRGEIQIIGASTESEYRRFIEKDGALARRFQKIIIEPTDREDTIQILRGLKDKYEAHHKITYNDDALIDAVDLSTRYITNRCQPDNAIDVLDESGARLCLDANRPIKLKEVEKQIEELERSKNEAVAVQSFEKAASLRDSMEKLKKQKEQLKIEWRKQQSGESRGAVTKEVIAQTVSRITGIPLQSLQQSEIERLLRMEEELGKTIIGQAEAVKIISKALRRAKVGLKDPHRPVFSGLFIGKTGTGKTLLAKALAKFMFGSEDTLVTIDCSELMEKHSVSKILGSPPGFVGYDDTTLLERIRNRKHCVLLIDECEKSHPDVMHLFLQILEEGTLTDSTGRKIDFKNTIILMTSNVGSSILKNQSSLGFGKFDAKDPEMIKKQIDSALHEAFRPEFLNRLDAQIVFTPLSQEEIKQILLLELEKVQKRLASKNIIIKLTDSASEFLAKVGYSEEFGARHLRRAVEQHVEDLLAEELLQGNINENSVITLNKDQNSNKLTIENKFEIKKEVKKEVSIQK